MDIYQETNSPDEVILNDSTTIPRGHRWWDDYEAWLAKGNTPLPAQHSETSVPPSFTLEELQSQLSAIQQRIEELANQG